jgi:hypothetical protein
MSAVVALAEYPNRAPGETETRALRELLQRDLATRLHLEQQQLHHKEGVARASHFANTFQDCLSATEDVQRDLKAAIDIIEKLLTTTQSAVNLHDGHFKIVETILSTPRAKNTFDTMISFLTDALPAMRSSVIPLESHVCMTFDECRAHNSIKASAAQSVSSMELCLDAIAASISEKKRLLHPIRRLPAEVLERIFKKFVKGDRPKPWLYLESDVKDIRKTLHSPHSSSPLCAEAGAILPLEHVGYGLTFEFRHGKPRGLRQGHSILPHTSVLSS